MTKSTLRGFIASRLSGRTAVFCVAAVIVTLRMFVYLAFEQLGFDSDQAIIGLMAKHLTEGRAFPLFYYGLPYLLGVEAWAAVPFFFIAGPTVLALRLSMLAWNLAFGFLIIAGLQRAAGLAARGGSLASHRDGRGASLTRRDEREYREYLSEEQRSQRGCIAGRMQPDFHHGLPSPWSAVVPALFFLAAPASVCRQLIAAQGGNIEPFVFIGVLWFLRRHPLWFGTILAIGFRNREFTLYAAPVLLVLEICAGELSRARVREWLMSLAMFFAVWESIEALKPFADFSGPGTRGQLLGGFSGSQIANLTDRFNWQSVALGERVGRMGGELLAWFTGAGQIDSNLPIRDQPWLVWAGSLAMLLGGGRLIWLLVRREAAPGSDRSFVHRLAARVARAEFGFYLLGVGLIAVAVFMAGRPGLHGYSRYVLLGVLVPIGLTAALLRLESRRILRQLVAVVVIAWSALMIADHVTVLMTYLHDPPPNPVRDMADQLVARHIPVARAGYWGAYAISFVAREQVRVASSDVVRIQEYQDLFHDRSSEAILISEQPCPGGERVARWYVCRP